MTRATTDSSWVLCTEITNGLRRDFCSAAFERDVMSHEEIVFAYGQNKLAVRKHFTDDASNEKMLRAGGRIIASYRSHSQPPPTVHISAIKLMLRGGGPPVSAVVDQSVYISESNLNQGYYMFAFRLKGTGGRAGRTSSAAGTGMVSSSTSTAAGEGGPAAATAGECGAAATLAVNMEAADPLKSFLSFQFEDSPRDVCENPDDLDAAILDLLK